MTIRTDYLAGESLPAADVNEVNTEILDHAAKLIVAPPIGTMILFPAAAPTKWLLCDGQAVSRTTYAALFALIGETFGIGDGVNTFNLPNLKGKVPVGIDAGQTEFDAMGESGGEKTHTLTTGEMPQHTHNIPTYNGGSPSDVIQAAQSGPLIGNVSTGNAGSGNAHNNLQPYLALNFIIKALN